MNKFWRNITEILAILVIVAALLLTGKGFEEMVTPKVIKSDRPIPPDISIEVGPEGNDTIWRYRERKNWK